MPKPTPTRYCTTNWSAYNAALRKRGEMLIWFDNDMTWLAPHDGRAGRPPVFSDAAIQFCLSIKVLFRLPLRQTAGMVAALLQQAGLDWPIPNASTLCRRQKTLAVQIPYRHTAVLERDAVPIIPIRKNGRPWKDDGPVARVRNETLRATRHYGRAFWKRYHIRSRIEAKMRCFKAFGERIAARDPDRQTAEVQIRIALINRFNALGTAEIVRVA